MAARPKTGNPEPCENKEYTYEASIQSRLAGAMREQGMGSLLLADTENFGYVAGPMLSPMSNRRRTGHTLALFRP